MRSRRAASLLLRHGAIGFPKHRAWYQVSRYIPSSESLGQNGTEQEHRSREQTQFSVDKKVSQHHSPPSGDPKFQIHEQEKVLEIEALNDQTAQILEVTRRHAETYYHRSGRPYYPLDDGWGLTYLSTGQPFFVNTRDRNITPWIIMGGHWETNVDRVLMDYARPGMSVLDIGANMGYYTVKLASKVGSSGRVFAFEPNPEVNAVCLENLKINGLLGQARIFNFALGESEMMATLTRSNSNMASANLVGDQDADYSVEVEVKILDKFLDEERPIDLIKLDAEGFEVFILRGAQETFARSPNCATMIELGLDRWERHAQISDLIPLCGGNGRALYAVQQDGTVSHMEESTVRDFLLTCPFGENYFLVARPDDVAANIPHLIM